MTKVEFLDNLKQGLSNKGLSLTEIEKSVTFYSEMIDDRMEDEMSEEEAVETLASLSEIIDQIIYDIPLNVLVKSKIKKEKDKTGNSVLVIVLLVMGFPVWFSLLMAAFAVVLSLYITIWSLIISMYACVISIGVSGLVCIPGSFVFFAESPVTLLAILGAGLILVGISILLFYPAKAATEGLIKFTALILRRIKSMFMVKESAK